MSLLRTDTRYAIDTMIAIAKTTTSPTMRESLLEEALEILRNGTDASDTFGTVGFIKLLEPSPHEAIRATDLYRKYCEYCLENGYKVATRKVVIESLKEAGYRFSIKNGYTVAWIMLKNMPDPIITSNPCGNPVCNHLFDKNRSCDTCVENSNKKQ